MNGAIADMYRAARWVPRHLGPFINIRSTFLNGLNLNIIPNPLSNSPITDHKQATLDLYHKLLKAVPGLKEQVVWTYKFRCYAIPQVGTFLEQAANKGRSDDCGSLGENGLKYIPKVPGYPTLDFNAKKDKHGFNHISTGRLLCLRFILDDFDEDPNLFCLGVINGTRAITHDDWPAYLYPEEGYNPQAINKYLLQGPFLLACYRHLFMGPHTALKNTPGKAPGKKSLVDIYGMTEVTPETIGYAAVMCRHVLNAKESWATQDRAFHTNAFYDNIIELFDNKCWAQETLKWWNNQVFGVDPRTQERARVNHVTDRSKLAAQRATRQSAATQPQQSD